MKFYLYRSAEKVGRRPFPLTDLHGNRYGMMIYNQKIGRHECVIPEEIHDKIWEKITLAGRMAGRAIGVPYSFDDSETKFEAKPVKLTIEEMPVVEAFARAEIFKETPAAEAEDEQENAPFVDESDKFEALLEETKAKLDTVYPKADLPNLDLRSKMWRIKETAEAEGVNIDGMTSKEEILAAIKRNREGK